ncbi:hypothetical protein RJ640_012959, partial [Escallonia rubra]
GQEHSWGKMLQIRLRRDPSLERSGGPKPSQVETVTVACPDHLVIADLPVAKSIGTANSASLVKTIGRRSRRQVGERVHFCVRCDFPIAVYGRLSPCEHAFCLDCARSDSICYLCDERIQKIQTIKMIEGIFICAAPHCLKSFLKKTDFESHIHEIHADLLHPNREKEEGNESDSSKKPTASDSTVQAPLRSVFSPNSNSQVYDREDRAVRSQPREQPPPRPFMQARPASPFMGQFQNYPPEPKADRPQVQGGSQESGQFQDKQQANISDTPFPEYPMHFQQPPNFLVPINMNPIRAPPPFNYPPFAPDGAQPFYGAPFQMPRPDSAPEVESEQGSLLGVPPGQAGIVNFSGSYPRPWNIGPTGVPFEHSPAGQGSRDAFMSDTQGRVAFFQGDYGRNPDNLAPNLAPLPTMNKGMEPMQGQNDVDPRDGKGTMAAQSVPFSPLPPPLHQRGKFFSGDMSHDGQSYGWQHEKPDNFGGGQD